MTENILTPTEIRLQCLRNGYVPIPNFDKRTFTKGWPKLDVTEELIKSKAWSRNTRDDATGLRVEGGLAVIDIDINHDEETMQLIVKAIDRIVPGLSEQALVRFGKGTKEAWFVRTSEIFSRIHGHGWIKPGETADMGAHRIEIFGGASPRQFGAFGAHTKSDDGTVEIAYEWLDGVSPADIPLAELPALTKAEFFKIADAIDHLLDAHKWTKVERSQKGESDAHRVYDLVEEMQFELADGRSLSLPELRDVAKEEEGLRCSASWLEGSIAVNTSRCIIGTSRAGHLTIWESAAGTTHMEASLKPRDYRLDLDRIAEKLKELEEKQRNRIKPGDDYLTVATKLEATMAYMPLSRTPVVPLYASSLDEGMTMTNFRGLMQPYCGVEIGPRGGEKKINPADVWMSSEKRVSVKGIQMRPDKPRPLYEDAGGRWLNIYQPPDLPDAGGDAEIGIEFITHLLPDERERTYFLQWLAFKRQRPDVPGPAVVMVARQYGTGRGTLFQLIGRLFGEQYVKTVPFHIFSGSSYQSQYNDWGAEALFACVSESVDDNASQQSAYKSKRGLYEHLKDIVEPKPVKRMFVRKGDRSFIAPSFTTYLIATNHVDALALPENDRRIAVLANGEPGEAAFWVRVNAWLDDDANVAAFGRWLDEEIDLSGYSPFVAPITTTAKEDMVRMAKSDLDTAFEAVLDALPGSVFVPDQVINTMKQAAATYGFDFPDRWQPIVKKMVQRQCFRVGVPHGMNWSPQIGNRRHPVYARSKQAATHWTTDPDIRSEILKSGSPDTGPMSNGVIAGVFKLGGGTRDTDA